MMKTAIFTLLVNLAAGAFAAIAAQTGGDLDQTFGTDGSVITQVNNLDAFQDVVIQPDQKILAVGMSFNASYTAIAYAMRFNPDGTPDLNFGTDGVFTYELNNEADIYSCILGPDGRIILAGATTDYTSYKLLLIQLKSDGTLDSGFGVGGVVVKQISPALKYFEDFSFGVAHDLNGNIIVSGSSYSLESMPRPIVCRFSPTGVFDETFGTDGLATIPVEFGENTFDVVMVQPDGKILASGHYAKGLLWYVLLLARFNEDGSPDVTFGDNGIVKHSYSDVDDETFSMALTENGKILISGFAGSTDYNYSALIMRFTSEGDVDTTFGNEGAVFEDIGQFDTGDDIAVLSDGGILMAGTSGVGPPNSFNMTVWKYHADGSRDSSFGADGMVQHTIDGYYTMIHAMDIQADGKIVLAGQARTTTNQNHFFLSRLVNDVVTEIPPVNAASKITIFPNPAGSNSTINILSEDGISGNSAVEFYSLTGSLVGTISTGSQQNNEYVTVEIPQAISKGAYFVRLTGDNAASDFAKLMIVK